MTEPASDGGAGSDPSMLQTTARRDGEHWVLDGTKAFITGAEGASVGIVMARSNTGEDGDQKDSRVRATMFLVDLPHPAIHLERILDTIDSSMPGGHAVVRIEGLRVPDRPEVLGEVLKASNKRRSGCRPRGCRIACALACGATTRAHEIATQYACTRRAFGKLLIDHEGVGFMLAENVIDLQQAELMIDWCAAVL